jgi:hypothetical protein
MCWLNWCFRQGSGNVLIELKLLPAVFSPNFKSDADFFWERNGKIIEFRPCESNRCSKANHNKTITTQLLKSNAHHTRKKVVLEKQTGCFWIKLCLLWLMSSSACAATSSELTRGFYFGTSGGFFLSKHSTWCHWCRFMQHILPWRSFYLYSAYL